MSSKSKEKIWFIFCILFIISAMKINYASTIKYINIIGIQIFCLYDFFKKKYKLKCPLYVLIICIILIMLGFLSSLLSEDVIEAFIKIITIIDFLFFSFILLPNFLIDIENKKIFSIPVIAFSIIILYSNILYGNDYIVNKYVGRTRLYAGFTHPNILAFFTFLTLIFSIIIINFYKHKIKINEKIIYYICILLSFYTMIRTDCRTTLLASFVFVCIYFCEKMSFKNKIIKMISSFMILLIIMIFFINIDGVSFEKIDEMLSYRLTYCTEAIDELIDKEKIWFGIGGFKYVTTDNNVVYIDMAYISYIYQFGIISFFILLIFLYIIYRVIVNISIKEKIIAVALFITFLIYNISENLIFNLNNFFSIFNYAIIFIFYFKSKLTIEENMKNEKVNSNNISI